MAIDINKLEVGKCFLEMVAGVQLYTYWCVEQLTKCVRISELSFTYSNRICYHYGRKVDDHKAVEFICSNSKPSSKVKYHESVDIINNYVSEFCRRFLATRRTHEECNNFEVGDYFIRETYDQIDYCKIISKTAKGFKAETVGILSSTKNHFVLYNKTEKLFYTKYLKNCHRINGKEYLESSLRFDIMRDTLHTILNFKYPLDKCQ